jgi:phosphate:Na+ symporter
MEEIGWIELLAGIGIFLFGILQLEESLKQLSGGSLRRLLRRFTRSWFRGVLSGTFATAVLQSSSAVSLMVLAFTGAGILTLENAIGVIIGSNLGTTLTSWIVATVGFKLKIEVLALPFIGLGGLGLIFFGKSTRTTNISKFMVGFGFLFLGLDYMKGSIDSMAHTYDLTTLKGYSPVVFVLVGLVLTAIVQSSSASMAIVLSAMHTGVLSFTMASYFVIGTNLGTTITVLVGALGPQTVKKRVAFSHLFFNLFTAVVAIAIMPVMEYLIQDIFHFRDDPVTGLALFHTLFNFLGIAVFFPFIGLFTRFIKWLVKEKKHTVTRYLHQLRPEVPEAGIALLRQEIQHLFTEVVRYHVMVLKLANREAFKRHFAQPENQLPETPSWPQQYERIRALEAALYTFASGVQMYRLSDDEARELNRLLHASRSAVAAAKQIKDTQHNRIDAEQSEHEFVSELMKHWKQHWHEALETFLHVLEPQEASTRISTMHRLHQRTNEEDLEFTTMLTEAISSGKLGEQEIPGLIAINRAFVSSIHQLINALRDYLFTTDEAAIVEKLSEKE